MDDNITVLVDAKMEYTKQLTNILVPYIFEGIKSIYETSKGVCNMNNDGNILMRFQEQLSQIPKWNQEIIDEEYSRIVENSGCDWLDELVTAVFLSHTKILTSIKSNKKQNKINLKIPKIDHFIHKCYIESAREVWKNPYLFSDRYKQCDYQRNVRDCNTIICESIEETIRKLLPVKSILKEYLGDNSEDNDNFVPEQYRDNLRQLVKKELELVKNTKEETLLNLPEVIKEDIEFESNKETNILEEFSNPEENNTTKKRGDLIIEEITPEENKLIVPQEEELIFAETIPESKELTKPVDLTKLEGIKELDLTKPEGIKELDLTKTLEVEEIQALEEENMSCEITTPINIQESKEINLDLTLGDEVNLSKKNPDDIKDINLISNIITNDLYNKNLENNIDLPLNEIKLDNMNFKKMNIGEIKVDELNLDNLDDVFSDTFENNNLEIITPKTKELTEGKVENNNIKRIVIDDDRNNLKKYTKDKNKSFRFFD